MGDFEPLLTDKQVGDLLGLDIKAVQHLCREGRLPAKKIGRYWRFRRSWIERWLEGEDAKTISGRPVVAAQGRAH